MLTPEEICIRRTARADVECEEQTDREVVRALVRIIDRVTSPEAVCAEFERLAREMGVTEIRFSARDHVKVEGANVEQDREGRTLAEAYAALKCETGGVDG